MIMVTSKVLGRTLCGHDGACRAATFHGEYGVGDGQSDRALTLAGRLLFRNGQHENFAESNLPIWRQETQPANADSAWTHAKTVAEEVGHCEFRVARALGRPAPTNSLIRIVSVYRSSAIANASAGS
jgi:hypothetical protein